MSLRDLRISLRSLYRAPTFTAAATLTLALGIGATAAVYSVVDAVLLRPLAYGDAERLVAIFERSDARGEQHSPTSPANFQDWRDATPKIFDDMTAAHPWAPVLRGTGRPEELQGLKASPSLFRLLGVEPLHGRTFAPDDAAERSVVLGHGLWQRRFGGDPELVGKALDLDGEPHVVVAVMPPGFEFPPFWATGAELWTALDLSQELEHRNARFLRVFARLDPGVDLATAQTAMDTVALRLEAEHPNANHGIGVDVEALQEPVVGPVRTSLLLLLVTAGGVLLIAAANVSNLLLGRTLGRRHEIALRTALGASRGRVVGWTLREGLILAALGAGLGLGLAEGAVAALKYAAPSSVPRIAEIAVDGRVVLVSTLVTLLTGLLAAALPAWRASRLDLQSSLRSGGRSVAGGGRWREGLVVAEIALTVMLLLGAGLLGRSLLALWDLDPGFDTRTTTVSLSLAGTEHVEDQATFFDEVVASVGSLPGVESVGLINHLPIGGDIWRTGYSVEGTESTGAGGNTAAGEKLPKTNFRVATPAYFEAIGIPLLRGRAFNENDHANAPGVVIVNRTLAERIAPNGNAVGRRIKQGAADNDSPWLEVVGVVADVRQADLAEPLMPELFFPYAQNPVGFYQRSSLVVRSELPSSEVLAAIERRLGDLAPDVPLSGGAELGSLVAESLSARYFRTSLLGLFALVALSLAAVGIYGVMSFSVTQRRPEMGLRLALGALPSEVFRLVVQKGLALAAGGAALGLLGGAAGVRLLGSFLFEVRPFDPWTFVGVPFFLVLVAFAATTLPAWRAMGVPPATTLRGE